MSFGAYRKSLGQKSEQGKYELLRFCNKLNTSVVGGASRLLKYFIKMNNPLEIISYSDKCWSSGNLYKELGFEYLSTSDPNYYYIIDDVRRHRFNYRKDKLVKLGHDAKLTESQIMTNLGYDRIYDCGSDKWKLSL
jgi:hypothetical protein